MSKKEDNPKIDPVLEYVQKYDINHLVGIDESRNNSRKKFPVIVAAARKLNIFSFNNLTEKDEFDKVRPSKTQDYKAQIIEIIKDPILSWFYYSDLVRNKKYNRCDQTILTISGLIRYIGENFLNLDKTLILIDGEKLVSKSGLTLELLVNNFNPERLHIKFIIQGDKKYKIIKDADTIAYNLAYGKEKKLNELSKRFPEKHIDVERYLTERGVI